MNLFETLRQFKAIEADPHFKEQSKRAILATAQNPAHAIRGPRKVTTAVFHVFETAAAVVFAGFFVLVFTGAISFSRFAPIQPSIVDSRTLRAEAQEIDKMQIQLENLSYDESSVPAAGVASRRTAPLAASSMATTTPTSTPSSTLSVTDALEQLSQ